GGIASSAQGAKAGSCCKAHGILTFISRCPTLLATCHRRTMAGTHTLLKPAFLARQLATSADIYLLASRCFLCESSFCRGSDQNNRGRQCTQRIERAHTVLLNQCRPCKQGTAQILYRRRWLRQRKPRTCAQGFKWRNCLEGGNHL